MKKKLLLSLLALAAILLVYNVSTQETDVEKTRKKHAEFLRNHPYNKTMSLSKKDRKLQGLPPNAFFEQEYLNEMNPYTGRTHKENVFALQQELKSTRDGQKSPGDSFNEWVERGPNNVGGRTRAVIFDPNDATQETVYAGGVSGGLWKNTNISNANSTWTQVAIPENLSVSCIAIDPNNSNVWYVGTGESYTGGDVNGNGVWKTTDGGTTWSNVFGGVNGASIFEANATVEVNAPASLAGDYLAVLATDFGGNLNIPITGDLVLGDDGIAPNEDGCTALTNSAQMNGKIAVIRRGSCPFVDKANNAQNAGAIAVIIVNNVAGNAAGQAGDDAGITIPSLMVSKEDGDNIIAALGSGVNATLSNSNGNSSGFNVSNGVQHVNDIIVRNNGGTSEVFVAAAETVYGSATPTTLLGRNDYGVYKSTDGTNFAKIDLPLNSAGTEYEPNNIKIAADNSVYISTTSDVFGDGGGAIFQSTNADATTFALRHTVPNGLRTEIACSSQNAGTIYVLAQLSTDPVGVYKTTNNFGNVFALGLPNDADNGISANDFTRGQAFYDLLIRVDPTDDNVLYLGGIDLFKSSNGGGLYSQFSHWYGGFGFQEVHADQHGMAFSSISPNRVVFSNDGGVYFSNDGGTTTSARNNGFNTLQFYTVGVAPTTALTGDNFLAGAQDNGTQLFRNSNAGVDGSTETQGGDGAYSFFDQDGTDQYYIANYVYNGNINLYNLANGTTRNINSESAENGDFINQEELDSNLDILYSNYSNATTNIIRRYSNIKSGTIQKTDLTNALMDAEPSAMKVSPYTTNVTKLLVGLKNGKLLKVDNANVFIQWSEITGPDFVGTVSDIEFGASENDIFVTMHNYGVENVWYSADGGATWSAKEGNLPDIPVKAILQNPLKLEEVIIGTELGVWRTANFNDANPTWVQSNNGMSNVKVMDLDLRDDNAVYAATYGRGVFSGKFTDAVASVDDVLAGKKDFTIYPTVSNGNFTLQAKNTLGKTKLNIFDINGKQVYNQNVDFSSKTKQEISVSLNSGIYIVNVIDENNKKSSSKIVIE
ncbi:T9SS type A sorting domain-containing protein [Polaribacter pectinis]|uniref:T9SS type A sorting domain-containing protein n=1 Tax=Polaribacter pectinis TaxID=2738844 RepID=A0A7G9L9S6_9FLAO|nr:T9SS type A sorting domain-containing protein [Polaribacter pectinis]QNM85375.1 T9SS type A sorting domain-containing protein [Polaribacter pectinis]